MAFYRYSSILACLVFSSKMICSGYQHPRLILLLLNQSHFWTINTCIRNKLERSHVFSHMPSSISAQTTGQELLFCLLYPRKLRLWGGGVYGFHVVLPSEPTFRVREFNFVTTLYFIMLRYIINLCIRELIALKPYGNLQWDIAPKPELLETSVRDAGFFLISWKRRDGYSSISADTLISIRCTYIRESKG